MFKKIIIINIIIIVIILLSPYYLFDGKLFVGGDDTRLFYVYPVQFFERITFFSWYSVSSLGIEGHNQYLAPFLIIWSLISYLIKDKIILNYLAFSLPLIVGFVYFQKSIKELFDLKNKNQFEVLVGSLFYILSPILIITQYFIFLIAVYLIGLIPVVVYYFLKYLHTSEFKYVYAASLWCLLFSFSIYAIPWLSGLMLPSIVALMLVSILFSRKDIVNFVKRSIVFFGFVLASQAFWITGFISTFLFLSEDSFAGKFVSQGFVDTFTPTVISTATGNVFYPLLNLFHRQIAFDFNWKLINDFINFYDKTFILNSVFILILIIGLLNFKKYLSKKNVKIYIFLLLATLFSLYLFTVNIGPLKDLFILFGNIPGFTMYRNFQDKFAMGFVILYASLISISLIILTNKFKKYRNIILTSFLIVVLINIIPIKSTINSPLWTTESIYKTMHFPAEYMDFMNKIESEIPSTNNLLSIPFGSSVYTVVKDEDTDNVYAGVSPVKVFSGVNDISGHYSFNFTDVANSIDSLVLDRNYDELNKIFYDHNINYVIVTKNIPHELRKSYLFNPDLYDVQDDEFIKNITGKKLMESSEGNYVLYSTKNKNSIIKSDDIYYKKVSPIKYRIFIKNLRDDKKLIFNDSYHNRWFLYLNKNPNNEWCELNSRFEKNGITECKQDQKIFEVEDLSFMFRNSVFKDAHKGYKNFSNIWIIDKDKIVNDFDKKYYSENEDGSVNIELVLYFAPQNYFYYGVFISLLVFLSGLIYLVYKNESKKVYR